MKKFLCLLLVLVLALSTAACGGSPSQPPAQQPESAGGAAASAPAGWTPTRDVTLYAPYAAGGSTDLSLRCLAEILSEQTGVNVNVVIREGGGGVVCTTQFMSEKPDGYSLTMISNSQFSTQPFLRDVEYTIDDFIPFIGLNLEPLMIIVPESAPYNTIEEFVDYFKEHPDQTITYGHSGNGGLGHLTQAFFLKAAGLDKNESIPYAGSTEAIAALLGGHITMCTSNYVEVTTLLENHTAKPLALIASDRSTKETFREVPTLKECGIDVDLTIFKFLALPAETPDEVVNFWFEAVTKAYQDQRWKDFVTKYNFEECGDWDRDYILDKLLPEIESTHQMLREAGLAVN